MLIKPAEGLNYADVVRTIRSADRPDLDVRGISKTKDGSVLLQTRRNARSTDLTRVLVDALGAQGTVKNMTPLVALEILDLDCLTDSDDVAKALQRDLEAVADRKVYVSPPNAREQKMAICHVDEQEAGRLLKTGRIKIGFVNCRIRTRVMVPRCYKCLGYGHYRRDCKGPDRRDCCWKCGGGDHVGKGCTKPPACFLCQEPGKDRPAHVAGSGQCPAFTKALTEAKTRTRTNVTNRK